MKTAKVTLYPSPFSPEAKRLGEVTAGTTVSRALIMLGISETVRVNAWVDQREVNRQYKLKPGDHLIAKVVPKGLFDRFLVQSSNGSNYSSSSGGQKAQIWGGLGGLMPWVGGALGVGALLSGLFLGSGTDKPNAINNQIAPEVDPAYDTAYPSVDNYGGPKDALLPTLTGVTNQENKWGEITCVFGKDVKVYPVLGMKSYSLTAGTDVFNYGCLDLGYGELEIKDCKIGSRLVTDMPDVAIEKQYGKADDVPFTIPLSDLEDTPLAVDLNYAVAKTVRAGGASSKLSIEITFPKGLWRSDIYAGDHTDSVQFFIEYKKQDATTWTGFYWTVTDFIKTAKIAYNEWTVAAPGIYDVRITRITYEKPDTTPWAEVTPAGIWTGGEYHAVWTNLKAWGAGDPFRPIKDANGNIIYMSRIAIKAKATPEQQGALEDFSCIVSRKLRHWNGVDFDAPLVTSNPADIVLEILTGQANFKPVPLDRIDLPAFLSWYQFCDEKGLKYNKVVDQGMKAIDLIREVCAAGRASYVEKDGKASIMVDRPISIVSQHFSLRNIIKDSFSSQMRTGDDADVIYAQFLNPDIDWQTDEIEVYDDGFDSTTARYPQTISFPGCSSAAEAHIRSRYQMADGRLRFWTHTFRASLPAIACKIGDRIRVSHDIIFAGLGQARVSSVILDEEDHIEGLNLDASILMEDGKTYGLLLFPDGQNELHIELQTTPGRIKQVYFVDSIPPEDVLRPERGSHVLFGEMGYEALDLLVIRKESAEDLTAQLTCIEYIEAVYDADTGPIPPYVSRIDTQHEAEIIVPVPTIVAVESGTAALTKSNTAMPWSNIAVTVLPLVYPVKEFEIKYKRSISSTGWQTFTQPANENLIIIPNVEDGKTYDVWIRARRYDNYVSDWNTQIVEHEVVGKSEPPPDILGGLHRLPYTSTITWSYPGAPLDFAGFIVKMAWGENRNWAQGTVIDDLCLTTQYDFAGLLRGVKTIMVKAVDMMGNEQAGQPAYIMTDFGDIDDGNIVKTIDISPTFPDAIITGGTIQDGQVVADDDGSLWFGDDPGADWFESPLSADWFDQTYGEMTLEFPHTFDSTEPLPFRVWLDAQINGPHTIEYLAVGATPWFPDPPEEDWFSDPLDGEWFDSSGDIWRPMPDNGIEGSWNTFRFRIKTFAGAVQGKVGPLSLVVDCVDVVEYINDFLVDSTDGRRVTPSKPFRKIVTVNLTPEYTDEYPDIKSAMYADKPSLEPIIYAFDASGNATTGRVDVILKGY